MEGEMIRAVVADDEKIIREGIAEWVDWNRLGICLVGCAKNGEEALAAVEPPEAWMADFLSRKIQDPEDPAQIKKASDALVRRGFSWHTVSQAVTRFLNGTDPW